MNARDLIKRHEGLRLVPYRCSENHWTVGYGHNLDSHGEPIPEIITLGQAEEYFEEDFEQAELACELVVPGWELLDDVRQAVLIDMAFNLGREGLRKFKNMLAAVAERHWLAASLAMMNSRWAVQVGRRADELSAMMESGNWPDVQKPRVSG